MTITRAWTRPLVIREPIRARFQPVVALQCRLCELSLNIMLKSDIQAFLNKMENWMQIWYHHKCSVQSWRMIWVPTDFASQSQSDLVEGIYCMIYWAEYQIWWLSPLLVLYSSAPDGSPIVHWQPLSQSQQWTQLSRHTVSQPQHKHWCKWWR